MVTIPFSRLHTMMHTFRWLDRSSPSIYRISLNGFANMRNQIDFASMQSENTEMKQTALTIILQSSDILPVHSSEHATTPLCVDGPAVEYVMIFSNSGEKDMFLRELSKLIPVATSLDTSLRK